MTLAAILVIAAGADGAAAKQRSATVDALSPNWVHTGLNVPKGGVDVTVTGDATCHEGGARDCPVGANSTWYCKSGLLGPGPDGPAGSDVPYGALAARFGGGKAFAVANGQHIPAGKNLQFVYNDCNPPAGYRDNAGKFTITWDDEPPKLGVTGAVRDEFGRGLAGVSLRLTGLDSDSTSTDAGGRYKLSVDEEGTYELTATGGGRGPNERYYIVQGGRATEGTAADVTLGGDHKQVSLDWELDRRLQFNLTTHDPARADGISRTVATLRALTQHGDPAPGVQLNVDPPSGAHPRAVICTIGSASRPLWPALLGDGSVSPAGIPPGPETTTDANGEVSFRVFPGTEPGSFNISGSRRTDDDRAYSSFFLPIAFAQGPSREVNGQQLARALVQGGVGFGVFGDTGVLLDALAGRQQAAGDPLSGVDAVPVATASGRAGVAFFSRGNPPPHSQGSPRVLDRNHPAFVLPNELLQRVSPDSVLPALGAWAGDETVYADARDGRTYLGWPLPTRASGGLGTCLENTVSGEHFVFGAHSPVRILLTDSQGRKLGTDAKGKRFNDAPGAFYSVGEAAYLVAPRGSYTFTVTGTGPGPVTLEARHANATEVARFQARKGARGTFKTSDGSLPKTFEFGGAKVTRIAGVPLLVKGLPKRLRVGRKTKVKLRVTDAFGSSVPATLNLKGVAGSFTGSADDRGRLTLTLLARKRGTVTFTVSAADLLPVKARATASG